MPSTKPTMWGMYFFELKEPTAHEEAHGQAHKQPCQPARKVPQLQFAWRVYSNDTWRKNTQKSHPLFGIFMGWITLHYHANFEIHGEFSMMALNRLIPLRGLRARRWRGSAESWLQELMDPTWFPKRSLINGLMLLVVVVRASPICGNKLAHARPGQGDHVNSAEWEHHGSMLSKKDIHLTFSSTNLISFSLRSRHQTGPTCLLPGDLYQEVPPQGGEHQRARALCRRRIHEWEGHDGRELQRVTW